MSNRKKSLEDLDLENKRDGGGGTHYTFSKHSILLQKFPEAIVGLPHLVESKYRRRNSGKSKG